MSKTTVSDALLGSGRVSEATRQKITLTARRMGYVSNRAARLLRRSQTGALGLYIPAHVRNYSFYMEFAFGSADEAAIHDLDLTLIGRTKQRATLPLVDGIIAVDPLPGDHILESILESDLPIVTAGRLLNYSNARSIATIEIDHYGMATALLNTMRSAGAHRPALISSDQTYESSYAHDVARAYEDWCANNGVESCVVPISVTPTDKELTEAVARTTAHSDVDAIVCVAQGLAARAAVTLQALGRSVGNDFQLASLVGDPYTELQNPLIYADDLRPREFGHAALAFLRDIISGQASEGDHRTHQALLGHDKLAAH